jgi:hypothetical protein
MPAQRLSIEGIGTLSFETTVTLSVGSEVAYAAPGITYFNSASTPADDGTNTANPTVVTPPANMQTGDLVIMTAQIRAISGTLSIFQAGGQTWTTEAQTNQSYARRRLFWCRFNGIWSANPSVSMGGSTSCNSVVMHVFRPSGTSYTWAIDVAQVAATFNAPSSPYTVTIPAISTLTGGALVFASWGVSAANTWGSLTAGWEKPWSAQYRNTSGSDCSQTSAYKVQAVAGNTGAVSQNESAGTAGARLIIAFKEVAPPPVVSITVSPTGYPFGVVLPGQTKETATTQFTLTNNGNVTVNIDVHGANTTGGSPSWTLSNTATPGPDIYGLKFKRNAAGDWTVIPTTDVDYMNGLLAGNTDKFGLQLLTPTSITDKTNQQTGVITFTAVQA